MKALLYCLLFLSASVLANDKIDSLQKVIDSNPELPVKIETMYDLAEQYYYQDMDKSQELAIKILKLSKSENYTKGVWKGNNILGYLQYRQANYDSAIHYFQTALALSGKKEYLDEQIFSSYWLGSSYRQKSEYESAEKYYKQCLDWSISNENNASVAKTYMGLGILHYLQGQYENALKFYLKADSTYGDEKSMLHGDVLQNIAITYHGLDQKAGEKQYLDDALQMYKAIDDDYGINNVAIRLGNIAEEAGEYDKSLEYFLSAIPYFQKINAIEKLAEIYHEVGHIYLIKKQYSSALEYFNQAGEQKIADPITAKGIVLGKGLALTQLGELDKAYTFLTRADSLANASGTLNYQQRVLKGFAKYYKQMGNVNKVYQYLTEANQLLDSLTKIKIDETLHEVEARYQNVKKQQEIELLAAQNDLKEQQKSKQLLIFLVVIAAMLIIVIAFAYLYKAKQRANRKLREADQMKSTFLTNITHEFRTPLHLISGPVEHRLNDTDLPNEQKQELQMIQRNSSQLLSLVDQLLELAKLESGNYQLREDEVHLRSFLQSLVHSFGYLAEQNTIKYHVQLPKNELLVKTFPDALQKIVMNLLGNAFKYAPNNETINIQASVNSGRLLLEVNNSGSRIEAKKIKQIFSRFYQENSDKDGLGIGLALVKELVDRMNGKITVDSNDQWTSFKIDLPIATVAEQSDPSAKAFAGAEAKEKSLSEADEKNDYTLLVVDDNADIREMMQLVFSGNFQVLTAKNGEEGLQMAREQVPDVIISDLMMPVMDGFEFCSQIRNQELTSHIPVIMLTAKAGDENALKGLSEGADDYLIKPVNMDLLKVKIQNLIKLQQQQQKRYSREIVLRPVQLSVKSREEQFIIKVRQILDNYLTDGNFNATRFSEEMGMSRMQLHRKLKALTGYSANELINNHRLEMAAELLQSSYTSVAEICYQVGFNDPAYFSRCFKERYKVSPKEFANNKSHKK